MTDTDHQSRASIAGRASAVHDRRKAEAGTAEHRERPTGTVARNDAVEL